MLRISQINLDWLKYFPSIFYDFFFSFSSFSINLFVFELCHFFSLFLLFSYFKSGLVKLTHIGLGYFDVFLLNFSFFTRSSFWNSFFLSWFHIKGCWFVKLPRVDSGFLLRRCILWRFIFVFIYDIRLLGLQLYNFLSFFFFKVLVVSYPRPYFS